MRAQIHGKMTADHAQFYTHTITCRAASHKFKRVHFRRYRYVSCQSGGERERRGEAEGAARTTQREKANRRGGSAEQAAEGRSSKQKPRGSVARFCINIGKGEGEEEQARGRRGQEVKQ